MGDVKKPEVTKLGIFQIEIDEFRKRLNNLVKFFILSLNL